MMTVNIDDSQQMRIVYCFTVSMFLAYCFHFTCIITVCIFTFIGNHITGYIEELQRPFVVPFSVYDLQCISSSVYD